MLGSLLGCVINVPHSRDDLHAVAHAFSAAGFTFVEELNGAPTEFLDTSRGLDGRTRYLARAIVKGMSGRELTKG